MRPRPRFVAVVALALGALVACSETRDGFAPVLGDEVSPAEKERFARRLYLDLTGLPANEAQTKAALDRLDKDGNSAATRESLAKDLTEAPEFGTLYLAETETAAFSGQSVEYSYTLVCEIIRGTDAACLSCGDTDACACKCPVLTALGAERQSIRDLGAAFAAGEASSSDVERAFAASQPFLFNGTSPEGITTQLFQAFLGRPAEKDELTNGRFLVTGSLLPDSPAGLLFHRHGANYDDLLDIVFESEVYRDALVNRVFQRYLGRPASPDELRFFSASLDPDSPDVRALVRAVVSSGEYFRQ